MSKHILLPLPYSYDALEPYIDARTMELHYSKHHQTYVDRLNAALEKHPELFEKSLSELLQNINLVPEDIRQAVINHGGGHANHSFFWQILGSGFSFEQAPILIKEIEKTFSSFESFKKEFNNLAISVFGSGWAWLVLDKSRKLILKSTPNQNSPLMEGQTPILGLDVWEHAYYLKYQNRRQEYIDAWWSVVNWEAVEKFLNV